ncbi:MAG: CotH kinase family protein [Bacilli bacterium]|nr:CotH kinase family protein [Bacilli bacterium]
MPEEFLYVFSYDTSIEVSISASSEAFGFMSMYQSDANAKYSETYVPADIDVKVNQEAFHFDEVGIRVKGNTSRSSFFYDGQFVNLPHLKVSLKATFDGEEYGETELLPFRHDWSNDADGRKVRKKRNLYGLEKFDLKAVARNNDGSSAGGCTLRELYAYDSFREFGVDAPYANLSTVTLRCGDSTISHKYEFIETYDKQFLTRRYGKTEGAGDLYKCVYNGMGKADLSRSGAIDKTTGERIANGKIGVENKLRYYSPVYQLKTNDNEEDSDFSSMANFIHDIHACAYGNGNQQLLESALDVDEFLRMSAVSYLLGNFDDQRYNYNNYYLYFRPSDGKAMVLPYDWDWCLGLDAGYRMDAKKPLDEWTLDGGTNSNLYQATLVRTSSPAYSLDGYRSAFLQDIAEMKDVVLNGQRYGDFAAKIGMENSMETSSVLEYMRAKRSVCS